MIDADTTCPVCDHRIGSHGDTPRAEHPCSACEYNVTTTDRTWTCGMTAADIRHALTPYAETDCRTCGGTGEVRHPRWGSSTCPDDLVTCPTCDGRQEA